MDDALQRLLETERRAEVIARDADLAREHMIRGALDEARQMEERFAERIPELHAIAIEKANARAEQTINELKKRYDERHSHLLELAKEREAEAVRAAVDLLTGTRPLRPDGRYS